jgi:dCMP deaminase
MPKEEKYAVVTLIPAIHSGYLSFFKKYPGTLYVIGKDFIEDFPHIERDLRTPDFDELKSMLFALNIFDDVIELTKETVKDIPAHLQVVMPDDEIAKGITEKYLKGRDVKFENIFLRWTRLISTTELEVPADRLITTEDAQRELIDRSKELAKRSADWWRQIGAIVVRDGKILIEACNKNNPSDYSLDALGDPRCNFNAGERFDLVNTIHAEAHAVALAAKQGIALDGATLYVTTFPCPVCARLVARAGIKKVYYSLGYSLLDAENILKDFDVEIVLVK